MPKAQTDISAEEQQKRRLAWETANASVLMEGGIVDDETHAMQERHITGEITFEEYLAWAQASSQSNEP
jgi:hypothetical protein